MKMKIDISNGERKIFFASDMHFYHKNVILFDKRPFLYDSKKGFPDSVKDMDKSNLNVDLMNETLINNWNDKVSENDIVFYLGDLSWRGLNSTKDIVDKLNGEIHFINGNHDSYKVINNTGRFKTISDYVECTVKFGVNKSHTQFICMMHYPLISWNRKNHNSYMIHGHTHGNLLKSMPDLYENNLIMDVGINNINYEPIEFFEVKKIMDSKLEKRIEN